ncbi:MAG: amidase [Gemmatimonadota bacterium]|nr:MAG: amidase [Gemmatimonadota bacterium]
MSSTAIERELTRRRFLGYFAGLGLSSTLLPGVLWARLQEQEEAKISKEMLEDAERVAGLEFSDEERDLMLRGVNRQLESYETLRTVELANNVPPALYFNPLPAGMTLDRTRGASRRSQVRVDRVPSDLEELAFWPVTHLSQLIESRRVSSLDLTQMYLGRLKQYGPKLECVITLTEELALEQARRADEEIAADHYRGPLHGIPWGAKDLLAVRGYKTTWGAMPYQDQVIDEDATVVRRLEEAGAVLVAKLTLGALAWGDVWYGGRTRSPWNYEQGSSGSSAGSAAATAAGLVGFAIGTETWGSIVSPSNRCGATGLRPTFGRVSRHGAMALSWSMDKIGPICRSVEDCALVFDAIYGPDGHDLSVLDVPFDWDAELDIKRLRIGYVKSAFEEEREEQEEWKRFDEATLETLGSLGLDLVPIELPDLPVGALSFILNAEAAAAFDDLTLSNRDDLLVRQVANAWPNVFRHARLIPAVEYIKANRVRTLAMQAMAEIMSEIDVYVCPSYGGDNLLLTNLTGHPCVVLPNGFREESTPTSITFMGKLFGEAEVLALARAYQEATDFHLRHPTLQA